MHTHSEYNKKAADSQIERTTVVTQKGEGRGRGKIEEGINRYKLLGIN